MTTEAIERIQIARPRPHSKEQSAFIRCTSKRIILKAGRRFGKTVGIAIRHIEAFLGICPACGGDRCSYCNNTGRVKPKRVLYAAPTSEQVGKYWYEVVRALSPAIEAGYFRKDETEKFIEVPGTEQRIKAKTAWNANTLRGDYAEELGLEEFQLMNEDAWNEVGLPMLLDYNGNAVFIFTPPSLKSEGISKAKDPRHASKMYQKYCHNTDPNWRTFHFTSYQNPLLSAEALAEISQEMSLDSFRREILAEDDEIQSSWMVYNKFNETLCRIKRFEIPKTWEIISGHDFGTANPAALFLARVRLPLPDGASAYLRHGDYVIFKEYAPRAGYSAIQHIAEFKEITNGYTSVQSWGGNITTEEEIRQHYGNLGWPIRAPLISKVNAQIDRVIGLMEVNKLYIFEDVYGLLGQIAGCMWELDENNKPMNKIKDEARYHLLACLRYLVTFLPVERPFLWTDSLIRRIKIW